MVAKGGNRGRGLRVSLIFVGVLVFGLAVAGAPPGNTERRRQLDVQQGERAAQTSVAVDEAPSPVERDGAAATPTWQSLARVGLPPTGERSVRRARLVSAEALGDGSRDTWHAITCPSPGAQVGDPCDCDDDCCGLNSADGCVRGQCRSVGEPPSMECVAEFAFHLSRCESDGDWCTYDMCDGFGNCESFDDNGGGDLNVCAKECSGGPLDGLWCFVGAECPAGECLIKANGVCDDSGGAQEEFCGVDTTADTDPPYEYVGRCCVYTCSVAGTPCQTDLDCPGGETCDGDCTTTEQSACTGRWQRSTDPDDLTHCWCPEYSSGIAPMDDELQLVGKVVPSPKHCARGFNRCETAEEDCVKRCTGGPDHNVPCETIDDCRAGASGCDEDTCVADPDGCTTPPGQTYLEIGDDYELANPRYLRVQEFRFRGGVENPGEVVLFEIWDNNDLLAEPVFADSFEVQFDRAGVFTWTIQVDCWPDCSAANNEQETDPPVIVPPKGFMVARSTRTEDPELEANFWWGATTTPPDIGTNDANVLWVDGAEVDELGTGNNTLMFELVGQEVAAPLGACCLAACEDTLRWGCGKCTITDAPCSQVRGCGQLAGSELFCVFSDWFGPRSHDDFVSAGGELCGSPPTPCDRGACCATDGTCVEAASADCIGPDVFVGAGTRCEPNCCEQPETAGDCACDTYICMDGAHCADGRVCSSDGVTPCSSIMDCPSGDTCDPDFTATACTYAGPGQQSDCPSGICYGHFDGSSCDPANGDADCTAIDPTWTCELACSGPTFLDLTLPGAYGCADSNGDSTGDPCDPGNGDDDCTIIDPSYTCEFFPGDPVEHPFSGDSTNALFSRRDGDRCNFDNDDMGWHEGFIFTNQTGDPAYDCAIVTFDYCCNEPIKSLVWLNMRTDCATGECTWVSPDQDRFGNGKYGYGIGCLANSCCEDGNWSATYTVAPGAYTMEIYGAPTCEGTITDCTVLFSDESPCDPGSICLPNLGAYTGHFTVQSCPVAACCMEDLELCIVGNRLQCENVGLDWCTNSDGTVPGHCSINTGTPCNSVGDCGAGEVCLGAACDPANGDADCDTGAGQTCANHTGTWVGVDAFDDPIVDCATDPCTKGVCCVGPGDCEDGTLYDTLQECHVAEPGALFLGGGTSLTCQHEPCAICVFADDDHCKYLEDGGYIVQSDISNEVRVADDFIPTDDVISKVCWSPCFLFVDSSGQSTECSAPGETPPDDWMLSVYPDDGAGVPDDENYVVFRTPITIDAKVHRGGNQRCWDYAGTVDPIDVIGGECYWLEIMGTGSRTCKTYWLTSNETNGHSYYDVERFGDYEPLDSRGDDFTLCVDSGTLGSIDCGQRYGVCCTCPGLCEDGQTRTDCDEESPPGGFILNGICDPNPCPGEPDNDNCADATPITGVYDAGIGVGVDVLFNNICATDDGPALGCGAADYHFDIWYQYTAEKCGDLVATMCGGASFDTILAFYDGTGGPSVACPGLDHLDELDGCNSASGDCCGDDSCFIGAGPSEVSMSVQAGDSILMRVGGWYVETYNRNDGKGWGTLNLRYDEICPESVPPDPEPGDACVDDSDCANAATCVENVCYVPKNRYVSIDPDTNVAAVALEVTSPVCPGEQWWIADPVCIDSMGFPVAAPPCDPPNLWVARLTSSMPTPRGWTESPLHIGDEQIHPGARYEIRATEDGMGFSIPLTLPAARVWADVCGAFDGLAWSPPDDVVDVDDLLSSISTFEGDPAAAHRTWMDLMDQVPDMVINFSDVAAVVWSFEGQSYPHVTSCACSGAPDCDNDLFCDGDESCVDGNCLPGTNPCTDDVCVEAADHCTICTGDGDCDDGRYCNGPETCVADICVPGAYPCSAGQGCNEISDSCVWTDALMTCELSADTAEPWESVDLEFFIQDVTGLAAYQTAIAITRTSGDGDVTVGCPDGVVIDNVHPQFVFLTVEFPYMAIPVVDCLGPRAATTVLGGPGGTVDVVYPPAYLATYTLDISGDATHGSTFEISVMPDPHSVLRDASDNTIPFAIGPVCTLTVEGLDCNGDGTPDVEEVVHAEQDCDNDGVCNECELDCGSSTCQPEDLPFCGMGADCTGNTLLDECETLPDCNSNESADANDICNGTSEDCNANYVPDECDIANLTSDDCTGNGIPDECEPDCNTNAVADSCDIDVGTSQDCNTNSEPDECDIAAGVSGDCNANSVPDECDIINLTSDDCTGNGIPDECEPDCNSNATADSCDIDIGTSPDCNDNDIPDECEIPVGCPGGSCTVDCDPDCDCNGTPDECDIAACDSEVDVGCDDCNLNGVPDSCDIALGTSLDDQPPPDGDGVPDECHEWEGGGGSDDWSDGGNWEDDEVPNNDGGVSYGVTISGGVTRAVAVDLDMGVEVDSLRLLNAATLNVTGEDDPDPPPPNPPPHDLTIATEAGLFVQGKLDGPATEICPPSQLLVANSRIIDVSPGLVEIGAAGEYKAAYSPNPVSAALTAETVKITKGICECPQAFGGLMQLTGTMSVTTLGDFIMDGSDAEICPNCCDGPSRGGISPPPRLWVDCGAARAETPTVVIEGDFYTLGVVSTGGCAKGARAIEPSIILRGSFINHCTSPEFFDVTGTGFLLEGTAPQTFEVGGVDLGYTYDGYNKNFAFGTIEVASDSVVTFQDLFDNDGQAQANPEALYVDTLVLRSGSSITIDRGAIYYRVLVDEGATITTVWPGALRAVDFGVAVTAPEPGGPACAEASDCPGAYEGADCIDGVCYIPKNRYLSIDPTRNAEPVAYRVQLTEAAEYPTAVGRTWWVDEPVCYDYPNGEAVPGATTCEGVNRFAWVSKLTDTPVTRVWTETPLNITDCGIAPAGRYHIRASADDGASFSDPLEIGTVHNPEGVTQSWGDITGGPVDGMPGLWLPPERATNLADVQYAIRTFESRSEATGFPPRVWVDVEINQVINLADIQFIVKAFEGEAYADLADLEFIGVHPADCP